MKYMTLVQQVEGSVCDYFFHRNYHQDIAYSPLRYSCNAIIAIMSEKCKEMV